MLVEVLSDEMRAGDLLVPGSSGASSEVTMQAFRVPAGVRVFNSQGLGPMGFGLSAAIGGCVASGRRRTVCIDGDGGLQLNIQEFETLPPPQFAAEALRLEQRRLRLDPFHAESLF